MKKTKVGIIGCGNISGAYLKVCRKLDILEVAACADLDTGRAKAKADEYEVPEACGVQELLANPEIEIVLNLTIPAAHAEVATQAIEAGKSVYNEKPLAAKREDGRAILQAAKAKKVLVGCAPDTFMGAGIQTCVKLLDDGWIGEPIGATAFMMGHGPESWHPDPEFYYKPGGGPMFDMGPYYLTALIALLGPVSRVSGCAKISFPKRVITSRPKYGSVISVDIPTHVTGMMEFVNGAAATILMSFDVWGTVLPRIEIYGSEGTLIVPDPNTFGGTIKIKRAGSKDWAEAPYSHGYMENSRGIGVADMAYALRSGRPHRASGELAFHVLDIMTAIHEASDAGKRLDMESTCSRPAPLPLGLMDGTLDE